MIEQLDGLKPCRKLKTLYISYNQIKRWDEVDKLSENQNLEKLTLSGNPIYKTPEVGRTLKASILSRIPWLTTIDNQSVTNSQPRPVKRRPEQQSVALT